MSKNISATALSVLDLVPYAQGRTISDAFQNTRELARHTEALGFKRYWMAEHHNLEGIASAATPILIGHVAEHTSKIRVGSGGIMLPNHSPLIVAEQFGTLATLYPNRIDLGLGRAPGTDQSTMRAIRRDNGFGAETDFEVLIEELLYYFAPAKPDQKLRAIPGAGIEVPIWILGSSLYSARLAAKLGRPYAFAGHFAPRLMLDAIRLYRNEFQPSTILREPYVMIGAPIVAAETDEKAEFLATSVYQRILSLVQGSLKPGKPPVESMKGLWSPSEEAAVMSMMQTLIVGGPKKIHAGMQDLVDSTQADELIITSDLYFPEDRKKSYQLMMEARSL